PPPISPLFPYTTLFRSVEARLRGEHARISPLPGPGVYATANSVAVPAVLPDGSIAPESLADIIDRTEVKKAPEPAPDDAHALTGDRKSTRLNSSHSQIS